MTRKSAAEKRLDKEIEQLYKRHAQGLAINVLDIGKVFQAGREAARAGSSVEAAIKTAIATYCAKEP